MSVQAHVYSLQTFFDDCRATLLADGGPDGQNAVRRHLVALLRHPKLIHDFLGEAPAPGRRTLHHEPATGMHVFVHVYDSSGVSKPHDHGPCWIVYGNLTGHTDMVDYVRHDDGLVPGFADLEETRRYRVGAGEAELFGVGAIHETAHPAEPSILIRVVSDDMDSVWRHTFDPAKKKVMDRAPRPDRD